MAYVKQDWLKTVERTKTSRAKRMLYDVIRPALSWRARRALSPSFLAATNPDLVLFTRGLPVEDRRRYAVQGVDIGSSTILVQGTGTGWDVIGYAALKPKRIIATDLFPFDESWSQISAHCKATYGVDVEFHCAPLEDHSFLEDGAIDVCASDAVFEHCQDLPAVMAETHRVVRPGGYVYASYGPMWYAPAGDHFAARGGLANVYNHVLLDSDDYQAFYERYKKDPEDFQSGGRYVELDLFSKLTTREYLQIFDDAGFERDKLILEVAPDAAKFREQHSALMSRLLVRNAGKAEPDDFAVRANIILLRRPA